MEMSMLFEAGFTEVRYLLIHGFSKGNGSPRVAMSPKKLPV